MVLLNIIVTLLVTFLGIKAKPLSTPTPLTNITIALPHNSSELLNIGMLRNVKPFNLPTIDEGYYTSLVANFPKEERFEVTIPEHLDDAYNLGDQYVQRLTNHGKLTNVTKRRAGTQPRAPRPEIFKLTAYDCDKPQNIRNLRHRSQDDCSGSDNIQVDEERTYTVIQETKTRRHRGFHCVMFETRRTYQCGGFDHSINIDHLTYENRPTRVPKDICERLAHRREFETYTGIVVKVHEGYNDIPFHLYGYTTVNRNGHVDCVGTDARLQGEYFDDVVVWINIRVLVEPVEFTYHSGQMQTNLGQALPPHCTVDQRYCESDLVTYIWSIKEDETCTVERTTTFRGKVRRVNGNEELMASDGSMIALTLKGRTLKCGHEVRISDIKDLFVQEGNIAHWRPIHLGSISTTKYSNAKDAWVFKFTMQEMQAKFRFFTDNVCSRQASMADIQYEAKTRELGVATWAYDDVGEPGTFATTAGESIYTYQCRETLVTPRITEQCYRELPVWVRTHNNQTAAFLEPYSRLLKKNGIVTPCSALIQPKFETTSGAWITAPPALAVTSAPAILPQDATPIELDWEYSGLDFATSGIYNYNQREQLQQYLQFGQNKQAKSYELAFQMEKFEPGRPISPDMMFPPGKVDISSWQSHVLGALRPLYNFLDVVGDVFSVGMVVTLILTWGKQVLNMTMATRALHYLFGCSWYLLWACLPKFALTTKDIQRHKKVQKRAGKRVIRKNKRQEKSMAVKEAKRERLALKKKKLEDARLAKEERREKKKLAKLEPAPALHPTVEELFRAWLDRSVTERVQADGAMSAAMNITQQPTRRSLQHLNQAMKDLEAMALESKRAPKQAPPRPPPPQLSTTASSPSLLLPQPADGSDDSLSTQACSVELSSPVYDALEAGKASTLPRPVHLPDKPTVPAMKRRKQVSFAPGTPPDECPYAIIRRSPTPYSAATQLLSEL